MVNETASPTPGTPYFNLTTGLQNFYAARGMWLNNQPRGALASMLGPNAPFGAPTGLVFFMTAEQIGEMTQDIAENGHRGLNPWQIAQALRRLRESLKRSGAPISALPVPMQRVAIGAAPVHRPFEPLVVPASGKARKAFEKHAMDCVRAVVEFSQESVYMPEENHLTEGMVKP
ncbi:MAG: hypothetical protein WAQ08_01605 [Aquabacterium sp.]|jgi:hypothetical protein|uniref:hypothetical protein n=1 Tax=Aquabacterium sp. TaxID=1872578 RepID=UPI003BAEB81D